MPGGEGFGGEALACLLQYADVTAKVSKGLRQKCLTDVLNAVLPEHVLYSLSRHSQHTQPSDHNTHTQPSDHNSPILPLFQDDQGATALHIASELNLPALITLILQHPSGIEILDLKDRAGLRAIHK